MQKHGLNLRRINSMSQDEVQNILDSAPTYYMNVEGVSKLPGSAKNLFEDLPPGSSYADKYVLFIENDERPIGVIDLVFHYPHTRVAFIGLFLIGEKYHGGGVGTESYKLLESLISEFDVDSIQLGVNDTNPRALTFWTKRGFKKNGRTRLNQGLKVSSTVHVMEKVL